MVVEEEEAAGWEGSGPVRGRGMMLPCAVGKPGLGTREAGSAGEEEEEEIGGPPALLVPRVGKGGWRT